jgi:hypothetical protein
VCKAAHFAIRTNLLPPFSTGNFEAEGGGGLFWHGVTRLQKHTSLSRQPIENEFRQNPLTYKLKNVFASDVMAKHRCNSVKTRKYLWLQPVLPNKYLGFSTQITESVNNNSKAGETPIILSKYCGVFCS